MKSSGYIEWCNENEGRSYPLSEEATAVDDDGQGLPTNILADLSVVLPEEQSSIRISSLYVSPDIVSVAVSSDAGGLLIGSFARAAVKAYAAYPLTGLVPNVSGYVVFGAFTARVPTRYRFATPQQSLLERRSLRVIPPPGVERITRTGADPEIYASGVVALEASPDLEIVSDRYDPHKIIVRLREGASGKYVGGCLRPASADECGVPPIRRINNVAADDNGTITLRFE